MSGFSAGLASAVNIYFMLSLVFDGVLNSIVYDVLPDTSREAVLHRLSKNKVEWDVQDVFEEYPIVARRITHDVKQFKNYGDVRIITFSIGTDIATALYTFKAETMHLNKLGSCEAKDIIVHLKRSSYAVVSPDGYKFMRDIIASPLMREPNYTAEFPSDGQTHHFIMGNPKPGYWYAIVYNPWVDPKMEKLEKTEQGAECTTILYSTLRVEKEKNIALIDCYSRLAIDYANLPAMFKCMTSDNIESINIDLTVTNTTTDSQIIMFSLQALSLPSPRDSIITCVFDPKLNHQQTITFSPYPKAWHYLSLTNITNSSQYDDCKEYNFKDKQDYMNHTVIDLMREDKGRLFSFEFGLPTANVDDLSTSINIMAEEIKSVRFKLYPGDTGGNLMIKAGMLMNVEHYLGYRRNMVNRLLGLSEENILYKTVVCLSLGHTSIPTIQGECVFNNETKLAVMQLFSEDHNNSMIAILVPFPESGTWYLTFRSFFQSKQERDEKFCLCVTNETKTELFKSEAMKESTTKKLPTRKSMNGVDEKTTIIVSVESMPCIYSHCMNNGNCKIQLKDTLIAFCECYTGYGGWDCGDDSRLESGPLGTLVSWLLFIIGTFLFLFAVYIAVIRRYFPEAVTYAWTVFLSSLSNIGLKFNFIEFGDIYCGLLCFWVTLLAMSILPDEVSSILLLVGAILIGVFILDNEYLPLFLVPFTTASAILLLSWYLDYRKTKSFRYGRAYYSISLPVGLGLVVWGLICYSLFKSAQTPDPIMRSFCYGVIASSVFFLLPDVKREENPHWLKPSPGFFNLSFFKVFEKSKKASLVGNQEQN